MTVLVLGVDGSQTDGLAGARGDTILVARLDPGAQRLSLLSLPRDLIVADAAGAPVLINSLADDPAALIDVVETQIGIPIDHVVQVDFDGFRALVDRIGRHRRVRAGRRARHQLGPVPRHPRMYAASTARRRWPWSRSRKLEVLIDDGTWWHDPYSDLGRVERQRVVVAAALAGLDRTGRSPGAVRDQVDWVVDHVTLDAGLSLDGLMALGRAVAALGPEDVDGATIPVDRAPGRRRTGSPWRPRRRPRWRRSPPATPCRRRRRSSRCRPHR